MDIVHRRRNHGARGCTLTKSLHFHFVVLAAAIAVSPAPSSSTTSPESSSILTSSYEERKQRFNQSGTPSPTITQDIGLDIGTIPEIVWMLRESESYRFYIKETNIDFRIAAHLTECSFERGDYIEIIADDGRQLHWYCPKPSTDLRIGAHQVIADNVMDNLEVVTITWYSKSEGESYSSRKHKGMVIVNLYEDFTEGSYCPEGYFDCNAPLCRSKRSTDASIYHNHPSHHRNESSAVARFMPGLRCILDRLRCNTYPNCGKYQNNDEEDKTCNPEIYCRGRSSTNTINVILSAFLSAVVVIQL